MADPGDSASDKLARTLGARGLVVESCPDARSARQFLARTPPKLVVMELRLTDGPTLPLLEWIKRIHARIPVVIHTNHSSVASALRCVRLGAEGYCPKPASAEAVLAAASGNAVLPREASDRPATLSRAIWEYINRVVDDAGSISQAATVLGLDRRSLRRMLSKCAPPT